MILVPIAQVKSLYKLALALCLYSMDASSEGSGKTRLARGYKTFFMLNSAEHNIYPAHKC